MISTHHFAEQFLGPVEEEEYAEEVEDDGLGYYEDGVKRTLTDEQIEIFRHSEIEALLRRRRHAEEADEDERPFIHGIDSMVDASLPQDRSITDKDATPAAEEEGMEDGELDDSSTPQPSQVQKNKKNKRKKNKNGKKGERPPQAKGFFRQAVKPDLRKRTWDNVDKGLANLDYDGNTSASSIPNPAAQRRRISYEDD